MAPQSSDLNSTEHLWDLLERRIRQHNVSSKDMLKSVLKDQWEKISAEKNHKIYQFNAETTSGGSQMMRLTNQLLNSSLFLLDI
ncbi:hypothetical protein TNCV_921891 [Trichonephila clavipes]|nr:hypothetical protein TNCV_921891 [Trichonephila clavipes]